MQPKDTKKTEMDPEVVFKLNRAMEVARFLNIYMLKNEAEFVKTPWLTSIFSYLTEDLHSVSEEIERLGLADNYPIPPEDDEDENTE